MRRLLIEVTAQHIAEGLDGSSRDCPVALALTGRLRRQVFVYTRSWFADAPALEAATRARAVQYMLSTRATRFILAFDSGHTVKPFRFAVRVPLELVPS